MTSRFAELFRDPWSRWRNGLLSDPRDLPPVEIGGVMLKNPVMNAAGTYGHGVQLGSYGDLARLGAFVTKSLSWDPWAGNRGNNLIGVAEGGMLNSVGLKNPGILRWVTEDYPGLAESGATVVVNIWGGTIEGVVAAAATVERETDAAAIEVNLSCPNSGNPHLLISHDAGLVRRHIEAIAGHLRKTPVWAKLSPSTPDIVACTKAAVESGAQAVTLVNTLSATTVDVATRTATLSGVFGGLSGPPLHPIALRAIYQVRSALPHVSIVGVGGVRDGTTAMEMLLVGANAVQVGTACFADPQAPYKVLKELEQQLRTAGPIGELVGSAIAPTPPHEYGSRREAPASPDPPKPRRSRIDQPAPEPRGYGVRRRSSGGPTSARPRGLR